MAAELGVATTAWQPPAGWGAVESFLHFHFSKGVAVAFLFLDRPRAGDELARELAPECWLRRFRPPQPRQAVLVFRYACTLLAD